ncbi:unnamed protein product [Eruca vesicaria subsp. sativa]|uniref:RNase H type-1 domain-containing protein n=1 Tax=Eruca vesicaria subsp. sativa TaxID=29727 RepID=A0ABC8KIF7_ERUVS|nr:unnamed protein product [Eruca vesicaria subsp. sativa]
MSMSYEEHRLGFTLKTFAPWFMALGPLIYAGMGWTLYNKQGQRILSGSASVPPTNTAVEAKAKALRKAVTQIKKLGYAHVTFCGDVVAGPFLLIWWFKAH